MLGSLGMRASDGNGCKGRGVGDELAPKFPTSMPVNAAGDEQQRCPNSIYFGLTVVPIYRYFGVNICTIWVHGPLG